MVPPKGPVVCFPTMDADTQSSVTRILLKYSEGDEQALEQLLPRVYQELKRLAGSYMRRENANHTLQPTALVHEAYFKLIDQKEVKWQNRAHFFGVAAQIMRRILIDHARGKLAEKRGGDATRVAFDEAYHVTTGQGEEGTPDLIALDEAMKKLALIDERQAKVVELRYFGGLNIEETAEALGTSPATVKRDWTLAKAWLFRELGNSEV